MTEDARNDTRNLCDQCRKEVVPENLHDIEDQYEFKKFCDDCYAAYQKQEAEGASGG